ncbi:MAG: NAD(P)/FAD-dependent oxidoreductase [Alphaproteobacteria bacterium]|nr:NAD(P)/FAD-dependent oxidoreductase [Alphaproteobacteria bacterium]
MDHVDCVVAGAGIIGLAAARSLAHAGRDVVVLEAEEIIGSHTSSRNSEVIHAGIYYPTHSLKAQWCVEGRNALYAYCAERNIAHERTGKLIVATRDADMPRLAALRAQAEANGVTDIEVLTAADAMALEPQLHCVGALRSPSTGIVDSHSLMLSYQGEAEDHGAMIAFASRLRSVRPEQDHLILTIDGSEQLEISCSVLVNAAGHGAWNIARSVVGIPSEAIPPHRLAKGNYYSLSGCPTPFKRLVYPMPSESGLGIHFTRDLAGQARFGPDVEWLDGETLDYSVSTDRVQEFEVAIRSYWPGMPDNALTPTYSGIRPKLVGSGAPPGDFVLQSPADHGIAGLYQLFGIESPGLTASLVIGEQIGKHITMVED